MKSAMVTGASGFIGAHLCEMLSAQGVETWAVCRPDSIHINRIKGLDGVHIICCALAQLNDLPELLQSQHLDVFYHLAWEGTTGPQRADYRLQMNNVVYACDAVKAAYKLGCERFIGAGTVYEHFCEPLELGVPGPVPGATFYAMGKRFAGIAAAQLTSELKMDFVWCRFLQPIGKYIKPEQLMAHVIRSAFVGDASSYGPGEQLFDILAVEDLAYGFYLAGDSVLQSGCYYIGSGSPQQLKEYITETYQLLGCQAKPNIGIYEDDGLHFDGKWFNMQNFCVSTGYSAQHSFQEAVLMTAPWIKK